MSSHDKLNILKLIADELPIPVIVHRVPDYGVVYMNQIGLNILGVDLNELQAIDPREYVIRYFNIDDEKDYAAKIKQRMHEICEKPISYFQQVKSKDGSWQLYASNTKVFLRDDDGNVTHVITTANPLDPEHHITIKINRLM